MVVLEDSRHEDEDLRLIRETLAGQQDSFAKLMTKHQPILMNSARRMLGNEQEAEDVVQQVFIEAFRHLKEFRGEARFSTWLYSISLNRCRNQIRSRKRRQAISLDAPVGNSDEGPQLQVADTEQRHDQRLETRMEAAWVRVKLNELSPDYREIFRLHYFADLPLQEVATRLKRPLNTVKVYLHRARKELYELWESENGPQRPR